LCRAAGAVIHAVSMLENLMDLGFDVLAKLRAVLANLDAEILVLAINVVSHSVPQFGSPSEVGSSHPFCTSLKQFSVIINS
jgi:hypothetical protein